MSKKENKQKSQNESLTLLVHPMPNSDLNHIENVVGRLAREAYKNGYQL